MTQVKSTRPKSITVISWFWIIIGIIMTFSALMGLIAFYSVKQVPQDGFSTLLDSSQFSLFQFVLDHFIPATLLQLCISVFSIIAGINFLRLRAWARTLVVILSWVCLSFVVCFGSFWIFEWIMKLQEAAPHKLGVIGLIMNVLFIALYSIPLIVIVRSVRSNKVRMAVSNRGKGPEQK